jgi:DNA-binding response OmpR family regulator
MSTVPYVLIVDDDTSMGQTLADMVGLFDWNTQVVTSPRAAIESLQRNVPSLILLDLNMPGVDGMEVCRFIKRDPIAGETPVVFVTAEDDPGTKAKAREAGAMDYLVKPVDIDRLEEILDKLPRKVSVPKPEAEKTTTGSSEAPKQEAAQAAPPAATPDTVKSEPPVPAAAAAAKPAEPAAKETVGSAEVAKAEPAKPGPASPATKAPEPPAQSA